MCGITRNVSEKGTDPDRENAGKRTGHRPDRKKIRRGAYLCAKMEYIDLAQKKKALDRALKVQVPSELYDQLRDYVREHQGNE